ncbi:hypothetical protein GQ607_001960 [Colletotrichum asianum]|uniref:Uncharacterized protein n=1 Tax=Colletotrichum asianum TaxID=702518 RepID=A0A8H3ZYP8_9PEZI|nr:hypothetical protein GQ607_001960 [Colletotrichum asianum]
MMLIHPHPAPAISSFPRPSTAVKSCPSLLPTRACPVPCHAMPRRTTPMPHATYAMLSVRTFPPIACQIGCEGRVTALRVRHF